MKTISNRNIYVKETFGDVRYVESIEALVDNVGPQFLKGNVEALVDVGRLRFVVPAKFDGLIIYTMWFKMCDMCELLLFIILFNIFM